MNRGPRTLLLLLGVALAHGGSARAGHAQERSVLELGTYGTFTRFDDVSLGFRDRFGAGGRFAVFLSGTFSLEASGDYIETTVSQTNNDPVTVTRLGGTLFAQKNLVGLNAIYLGAGYERLFYRAARVADDNGVHVAIGDKLPLGGRAAIRIEGRAAYFPNSPLQAPGDRLINLSASAGISIFAFGRAPRDTDGDGVADKVDDCAETLVGAVVDQAGCPVDTDTDGVFDGIDVCPDTQRGADVDEAGCPMDDDVDGVFNGIDLCPDTPQTATADENGCPFDTDGDGVFDGADVCPDTPMGATVDEGGCPADSDGDEVMDGIDQCNDTPLGTTVDASGCPADQDGDGILNDFDQCPNTPAGIAVTSNGCPPVGDADRDGIDDNLDRCANTAPGQHVDAVGCPILFVVEQGAAQAEPLILRGVRFATGRSRLTASSYQVLNDVAASLLAHPEVRIEIAGHTDNTGRLSTNMRLSLARAEAVRAYLAQRGVAVERMEARGYGPDEPIATNRSSEGRAQNRRVELRQISER